MIKDQLVQYAEILDGALSFLTENDLLEAQGLHLAPSRYDLSSRRIDFYMEHEETNRATLTQVKKVFGPLEETLGSEGKVLWLNGRKDFYYEPIPGDKFWVTLSYHGSYVCTAGEETTTEVEVEKPCAYETVLETKTTVKWTCGPAPMPED